MGIGIGAAAYRMANPDRPSRREVVEQRRRAVQVAHHEIAELHASYGSELTGLPL
jgi:hypothetical protein